tara:strand:+ start:1262 stop:1675 length:414 start_codon:yes stop_codon:yes gene_type:complete
MGNIKSKPKTPNRIDITNITLSFQKEYRIEIITPELINRKSTGDLRFSYFKISKTAKNLVEKNYPFYITIIKKGEPLENKFVFSENYRTNNKDYNITINNIDNYRWIDYSLKKYPFIKIRHNRSLEPCEIIINDYGI